MTVQLTTIEVGLDWNLLLFFFLSPLLFFASLAARPLESKVIQIQSDPPPASSPPVAAMEWSKVICPIQV